MNSKLLTIDQVAEYLGVHRDTVSSLIRSGRLPALQLGGRKTGWRITEEDLLKFVQDGKTFANGDGAHEGNGRQEFEHRQSKELQAFLDSQRLEREDFNTSRRI
jgi:excisionase family DNA binding protein